MLAGLTSEYDRAYYAGIVAERRAKAQFARAGAAGERRRLRLADGGDAALRACRKRCVSAGNDDARLRWNACVRFIQRHPQLRPTIEDRREMEMLE